MQENLMYTYFHGLKKTRPSQIGMLCKGEGAYNGLYKNLNKPVVDKNTKAAPKLYLSHELTQDETVSYVAGLDINVMDLEKRTLASNLLITGRSILNMAKKGVRYYKKAMAYTAKKWDLSTNEPLDSGDTKDDVIEFVRRSMYLELHATDALDDSSVEGESGEIGAMLGEVLGGEIGVVIGALIGAVLSGEIGVVIGAVLNAVWCNAWCGNKYGD